MNHKFISLQDIDSLTIKEVTDLYKAHISSTQTDLFSRFGFGADLIDSAQGCYLQTQDGRTILDATGGIGVLNHGHNHPRILSARENFARQHKMEVHKAFHSSHLAALSYNIASLLPKELTHSYFPNSGAEAVESAMKMAFKYHKGTRNVILHSNISFHGKLFGSGSITGSSEINFKFPKISGVDSFIFNDISNLKDALERHKIEGRSDVYAIVVEPYNVSSMNGCSSEFMLELRKLCDENEIILIFDEVYSGWCKTGDLFYFMRTPDLVPDILCYAKSFGGGKASISGITAKGEIYRKVYDNQNDVMLQSTTYYGFGEETATAIEALQIIVDDDYVGKSRNLEIQMNQLLEGLLKDFPSEIEEFRGAGALWGIKLKNPSSEYILKSLIKASPYRKEKGFLEKIVAGAIIDYCYRKHSVLLFLSANQETLLKISFPLIATSTELQKVNQALRDSFTVGIETLLLQFVKENLRTKFLNR
jgi:putrescine aminotransferase